MGYKIIYKIISTIQSIMYQNIHNFNFRKRKKISDTVYKQFEKRIKKHINLNLPSQSISHNLTEQSFPIVTHLK